MHAFDYTPYFCEENIWRLAASEHVPKGWVVFVYSTAGACPVWNQKAGGPGQAVFWDYHVVYAGDAKIWDLDSVFGPVLPVEDWVNSSFPLNRELPPEYRPWFRMIEREDFLESFSSDRSHMKRDGEWLAPPPSWPPIFDPDTGMNLDSFRTPGQSPGVEVKLDEFVTDVLRNAPDGDS